jgi:uncharacterized protein (DUF697 family)
VAEKVTEGVIMKALDWAYKSAVEGMKGVDSAQTLALEYLATDGTVRDQVNRLIRWQNTKAGTTGFLTGLGGIIAMPVTVPTNIAVVLFVQVRMIAAIAHMSGQDLKDDRVKTLVYACLAGDAAKEILRDVGIVAGTKITTNLIAKISGKTLTAINQRVGFRLLTKFGEKGVVNIGKAIPLVGGIIGGTVDAVATNIVGNVARDTFTPLRIKTDASEETPR